MKIAIGADHAGFDFKEKVKEFLIKEGYSVEDYGAYKFDKDDDYPEFIGKASEAVSKDPEGTRGIIFGRSGQAEAMLANKFRNVRCALFYAPAVPVDAVDVTGRVSTDSFEIIRLTREHNNANVLCLGTEFINFDTAKQLIDIFLNTEFSDEERHIRRLNKIRIIENK